MEVAKFDKEGEMLAIAGRRGYVHFMDWKAGGSAGGGQIVGSIKMNSPVKDVCWVQGGAGGRKLMTLGQDAEVYLWDVGSRRCVARWKDEGNFGAGVLEGARGGGYYAVGYVSFYFLTHL